MNGPRSDSPAFSTWNLSLAAFFLLPIRFRSSGWSLKPPEDCVARLQIPRQRAHQHHVRHRHGIALHFSFSRGCRGSETPGRSAILARPNPDSHRRRLLSVSSRICPSQHPRSGFLPSQSPDTQIRRENCRNIAVIIQKHF